MKPRQIGVHKRHKRKPKKDKRTLFLCLLWSLLCLLWSRSKHVEGFELAVQDRRGSLETEPTGNHCGVDAAKIGRVDEIVTFVELRQTWNIAVVTAFHLLACDEHQVGRPMIRSEI